MIESNGFKQIKLEGKDGKFHSATVTVVVQNDNVKTTLETNYIDSG